MKTMIALVSDQRMQNVIPLHQVNAQYNGLVLVMSKERRTGKPFPKYEKAANDLIAVLGSKLQVKVSDKFVDPYNIEAMTSTISALVNKYGNQTVVNISGGTKPMAISALRAAQAAGVACLYTNTEDNEILWLSPDGSITSEPIQVANLDVPLYIRAYGERVIKSKKVTDLSEIHKMWANILGVQHKNIYQPIINKVTSAIKQEYQDKTGYPVICQVKSTHRQAEIIEQLANKWLWLWDQNLKQITLTDKQTANFLNGGWIEILVAIRMQQSGLFDDVLLNIELDGIDGEIDVAAVSNGKLVLVECKSNVKQAIQLNKLDSFRRRLGGPYAQAYYARASEANANQIRQQCQKIHLDGVFFGTELYTIGEKIGEKMRCIS